MRFTLLPFQEETVATAVMALRLSMDEVARVGPNSAQAVTLTAPTGAGKTVMAAAALEALFWGDENAPGDEDRVVVWLSDLPNVNEQTRRKIERASDRLDGRLVQIDTDFREDEFKSGHVYFLNTQKLSSTSTLVEASEERRFTIWEVIDRTIARDPSKFLLVVDEAHRGMERPTTASAQQATSIVQRFIFGTEGMRRSPVVLGISATPQRFDELIGGTQRTVRRAEADITQVRVSGLLKERIIVWRPEHGIQHTEVTLLQRAAQTLQDYDLRWSRYTGNLGLPPVVPVMVVQVEDRTSDAVTATDLQQAIDAIEEVVGPLHPDSFAHCFGDAPAHIDVSSRRVRYIRPADIDTDPQLTVVFFKTSLSTGWDCPRAEVIMSFRAARDATYIAQLVGRLVRTPLAQRVESDEVLNSVALYLPRYDRGAVQNIVRQLRAGDPDFLPGIDAEEGNGIVNCERREEVFGRVEQVSQTIRTYRVPRVRRMPPVARLERLAGSLSDFDLYPEAPDDMDASLVDVAWNRLEARRGEAEFDRAVERSRQVGLTSTTLSYLTGETETMTVRVQSTSRSLERVYEQVGARIGAGLHDKFWRRILDNIDGVDGDTARLYVIATLGEPSTREAIDTAARQTFDDWLGQYEDEIDALAENARQEFDRLAEHADAPTHRALSLPLTVRSRRSDRSIDYPANLYQDENGLYPETLNEWEKDVLETELARPGAICWVRNKDRQAWALAVPYDGSEGRPAAMYPDFIFFRESGGQVLVDLIDPHGVHLPDAPAKARGFAKYARQHGRVFDRIEMVIYDRQDNRRKALNLKTVAVRDQVIRVTTNQHLNALFDLAGA